MATTALYPARNVKAKRGSGCIRSPAGKQMPTKVPVFLSPALTVRMSAPVSLRAPRAQGEVRPTENGSLRKTRGWRRPRDGRPLEAAISSEQGDRSRTGAIIAAGGLPGPYEFEKCRAPPREQRADASQISASAVVPDDASGVPEKVLAGDQSLDQGQPPLGVATAWGVPAA